MKVLKEGDNRKKNIFLPNKAAVLKKVNEIQQDRKHYYDYLVAIAEKEDGPPYITRGIGIFCTTASEKDCSSGTGSTTKTRS